MGFVEKRSRKLNWRERRQFVSAHIYLNTGGDVFGQPNDMINHLLIMRLYFLLILPLCDDTVFALMFICVEIAKYHARPSTFAAYLILFYSVTMSVKLTALHWCFVFKIINQNNIKVFWGYRF